MVQRTMKMINKNVCFARLPIKATISSAEGKEIELAFEQIKISKYVHFTIFLNHFPVNILFIV